MEISITFIIPDEEIIAAARKHLPEDYPPEVMERVLAECNERFGEALANMKESQEQAFAVLYPHIGKLTAVRALHGPESPEFLAAMEEYWENVMRL